MPNRLAGQTSPYLLQHADNPVNWYPWCDEAFQLAHERDLPVFLSIGYSACHWCHVMEHESFENQAIADKLNQGFVSIKVDREERPDLDQIYMQAVQLLTQRGGWPMSVFLTPEAKPFFGGTYWPLERRGGMPGFDEVLDAVTDAWTNRRDRVTEGADTLSSHIAAGLGSTEASQAWIDDADARQQTLRSADQQLSQMFDATHGGFGTSPKFPHAMDLQLLLRSYFRSAQSQTLNMVTHTLDRMAGGGIYDHLGGGFARYSVDQRWLVPHFEKMLYDNALLADAYLEAWQVTHDRRYKEVVRETLDYVLRDMTDAEGGFYSTEDADSEGEEGKFYVWTPEEIVECLGQQSGERFNYVYDVSEAGNFEGKNILNLPRSLAQVAKIKNWDLDHLQIELAEARKKLLQRRNQRVPPGKDDKILTSWNGLMIHSLARAACVLAEPRYEAAAVGAAEFLWEKMRREDGRLLHSWRKGQAKFDAYLDDYANLANAFLTLYQATEHVQWIERACQLCDCIQKHFADPTGAFYYTADDHEKLIARTQDLQDGSVPSGNSIVATAFLRLWTLTGQSALFEAAGRILNAAKAVMERSPIAASQLLNALDWYEGPQEVIVVVMPPTESHRDQSQYHRLLEQFHPRRIVLRAGEEASDDKTLADWFRQRPAVENQMSWYRCVGRQCDKPLVGNDEINHWLVGDSNS